MRLQYLPTYCTGAPPRPCGEATIAVEQGDRQAAFCRRTIQAVVDQEMAALADLAAHHRQIGPTVADMVDPPRTMVANIELGRLGQYVTEALAALVWNRLS